MGEARKTLLDHLDAVCDRETFLAFVQALVWDREEAVAGEKQAPESHRGYGAFGWQNDTIESYLEASICCARAQPENEEGSLSQLSWKEFAEFLYGGKIYE